MEMKKMLKKSTKEVAPVPERVMPLPPSYESQWLAAGLIKEENSRGIVYKRIVEYDLHYKHGDIDLSDLQLTIEFWRNANEVHPLAPDFSKRLVFFDTETTGLKGAGTLIFLLGFIEQTETSFTLTQYVLPGPDHESAFLYASKLWETEVTLVTYNGKSFDLPQLETRWTMNRGALPPLKKHAQIDLLHGSRRIWKDEIGTFRLTTIEEEKLGFFREGDIPGYMAPIIYQDAVKSGQTGPLMQVLRHNEWDILSLVALYIKSTKLLLKDDVSGTAISETNIGKWFAHLKSYGRSEQVLERVIQAYGTAHPVTHFHFGFIMKRKLAYVEAAASFTVAAKGLSGRKRILALEELAKLYEHKLKVLETALSFTKRARYLLSEDTNLTSRFRKRAQENFLKREMRIVRKIFPGKAQESTNPLECLLKKDKSG